MEENRKFCRILIKRRVGPIETPEPNTLEHGELAFCEGSETLFIQTSSSDPNPQQ